MSQTLYVPCEHGGPPECVGRFCSGTRPADFAWVVRDRLYGNCDHDHVRAPHGAGCVDRAVWALLEEAVREVVAVSS